MSLPAVAAGKLNTVTNKGEITQLRTASSLSSPLSPPHEAVQRPMAKRFVPVHRRCVNDANLTLEFS